jgi:hypothetical protein
MIAELKKSYSIFEEKGIGPGARFEVEYSPFDDKFYIYRNKMLFYEMKETIFKKWFRIIKS